MAVEIFSPNRQEKMCRTRGSISVPLDSQATSLPTELWRLANSNMMKFIVLCLFDLLLYIHGKQLRSCWICHLSPCPTVTSLPTIWDELAQVITRHISPQMSTSCVTSVLVKTVLRVPNDMSTIFMTKYK